MKVLITGGAGFIGSHLVQELLRLDHIPIVLDNLSTGVRTNIPNGVQFINCDINNPNLTQILDGKNIDAIIHLAGQTMVNFSVADPVNDMEQNIKGTVHLLEIAKLKHIKRIIFSSTAASYGDVSIAQLPIKEETVLNPMSFYGLSKVTAEKYIKMYQKLFGIDYVIFRFSNVYGERQGNGGEGGVISIFCKQLANHGKICIFGDGNQTRDFIYAGDIAKGLCRALITDKVNDTYNLSTGKEHSLRDIIKILSDIINEPIFPEFKAARIGDIYRSALCNKKAVNNMQWKAEISLEEGLSRTYQYFANLI